MPDHPSLVNAVITAGNVVNNCMIIKEPLVAFGGMTLVAAIRIIKSV